MGYVVLHMSKAKGNDSRTTAHIERTVEPKNADPTRTHLNKELIDFPEGVDNRTQAIQHRIEIAGIKRKITKDQVRVIRINLSGTHEDMKRIEAEGRLDEWSKDSIDYLKKEFGEKNVVSAVLHLDEKTPHIHASIVPIVTGERRKAKEGAKKKNTVRLCADDIMTRTKMEGYQDTYAEAMAKYGLQRGIKGSEARHITTGEYYRELFAQNEDLKENIEYLKEQKQEAYDKVRDMYDRKDEAREKFLNMHEYTQQKEQEISNIEAHIEQLKQDYAPYKAQDDLNLLYEVFPILGERLRITRLCKAVGLAIDTIKHLFNGKAISISGKLHSPEHNQSFSVQNAKLQMFKDQDNPDKLKLSINGKNIIDWFSLKYQEMKQAVRPHIKPIQNIKESKGKGFKR